MIPSDEITGLDKRAKEEGRSLCEQILYELAFRQGFNQASGGPYDNIYEDKTIGHEGYVDGFTVGDLQRFEEMRKRSVKDLIKSK